MYSPLPNEEAVGELESCASRLLLEAPLCMVLLLSGAAAPAAIRAAGTAGACSDDVAVRAVVPLVSALIAAVLHRALGQPPAQ